METRINDLALKNYLRNPANVNTPNNKQHIIINVSANSTWRKTRGSQRLSLQCVKCSSFCVLKFISCFLTHLIPAWTYQRFSHHHLDLLLSQHSKLSKQTLDDKLPRLELRVDGDARHGDAVLFLPQDGSHWGGCTASNHAAADWCRSCREARG